MIIANIGTRKSIGRLIALKPWNDQRPPNHRPSLIPRIKERHNLFLYVTLVIIAILFIIAPPGQASPVPAYPPSDAFHLPEVYYDIPPAGLPVAGILQEPDAGYGRRSR